MTGRNPITIDILEILDTIDRRGSFAKAAEELNKATSAISYGIQKLEEQLDIALFQRQGRRSVLTPAGRLVLEEGRKILNTTARLADRAKEVATGWEPRIRIAVESLQSYPVFF
jgi:DNA-binding transcriptional LysR family regulator